MNKNYYQILGVQSSVNEAAIKQAYRQLVKSLHPDAQGHHPESKEALAANETMMQINEAYSTLIDAHRRAEYDIRIGIRNGSTLHSRVGTRQKDDNNFSSLDEERERARFLRSVFAPARTNLSKCLSAYKTEIKKLSADPYDDELVEGFHEYVQDFERTLRKNTELLTQNRSPRSLESATLTLRQCMAQAVDGMEELRYYLQNYNYNHLTTAESLFRIANELSQKALTQTRG